MKLGLASIRYRTPSHPPTGKPNSRTLSGWRSGPASSCPRRAPDASSLAKRLGVESVATTTLCQGALLRSVASGVAVYDTLFVELAARVRCPLLTFDRAVIKAFPDIAIRPRDLASL